MASTASVPEVSSTPAVKIPLVSLLVVCVVAVVAATAACSGVLLYLAHHGKLGAASSPTQIVVDKSKLDDPAAKNVVLEPMLVNLADESGRAYLRLSVVLVEPVDQDAKGKEAKASPGADAAVRDAILTVLGRKTAPELLSSNGKELLKQQLKTALDQQVPQAKVRAVYFTDFLVQQ